MQSPRPLRTGDTIGIMAPASPVRPEFLAAGEAYVRELGFEVRLGGTLTRRARYTAGTTEERTTELNQFIADPVVRAIWFARGGYGSPHLTPGLDARSYRADPKLFIGASDITALLLWSLANGVRCLHGPMPAQELARDRAERAELVHHLTTPKPFGELSLPMTILHAGVANGTLTGGCLSLVVASLGTPWEIDTEGCILLLEDAHTKPYQIDRMLTQLIQAGKLSGARAVLFGEMPGCVQTADQGYSLDDVLTDLTAPLGVPVVTGLPFGHTNGVHRALPLGVAATLDTAALRLTLDEAVTG